MLLQVKDLKVSFKLPEGVKDALRGVSFSISEGEIFALLGETGSGKSVTAKSIIRLLPPQAEYSGSIIFERKNLLHLPEEEMRKIRGRKISMIFQEPMTSLNPTMKVGFQVAEVLTTHFKMKKKEALEKVIELFKELMIPEPEERIYSYPHLLSGGMRQRVMIAMALIAHPKLILADEPTTALDVTVQAQTLKIMKEAVTKRKTSMLFITHDFGVACEIAHRVGILYHGILLEEGPLRKIVEKPYHPYTIDLLNAIPKPEKKPFRVKKLDFEADAVYKGCPYYKRCDIRAKVCENKLPELIEVEEKHKVRCFAAGGTRC